MDSKQKIGTRTFENSHGRLPRGTGRWGFDVNGGPNRGGSVEFVPNSMTLTEAKAWARKQAWFATAFDVEVAP